MDKRRTTTPRQHINRYNYQKDNRQPTTSKNYYKIIKYNGNVTQTNKNIKQTTTIHSRPDRGEGVRIQMKMKHVTNNNAQIIFMEKPSQFDRLSYLYGYFNDYAHSVPSYIERFLVCCQALNLEKVVYGCLCVGCGRK